MKHGRSDVMLALGVIGILVMMIIPVPPVFLDLMLALNIMLGLVILLVALYTLEPLQFSIFPGMLLILTLFRLSINVASTRLILGEGYAGKVILAFGDFVVGGNIVVGFIVFLILVLINFIVITKGSGRVAEVAARFTLDVCRACSGYIKSCATLQPTPSNELLCTDLASVEFDLAALERGFLRPPGPGAALGVSLGVSLVAAEPAPVFV